MEPEPSLPLPSSQVSGCQKVSKSKLRSDLGCKRPKGPERDKTRIRTGPSQTEGLKKEKRKTPNFAHPGFGIILSAFGLSWALGHGGTNPGP